MQIVRKRIASDERLKAERAYRGGDETGSVAVTQVDEPFAFMHRGWDR